MKTVFGLIRWEVLLPWVAFTWLFLVTPIANMETGERSSLRYARSEIFLVIPEHNSLKGMGRMIGMSR